MGYKLASLFTRIIKGEIPSHKIFEDDRYFAFLDIRPVKPGHTLVIPKQEVDYLYDLDDETLAGLFVFSKKVAKALKAAVPCARVGIMVAGLEVPHAHVHLIPMDRIPDLNFANAKAAPRDELEKLAEAIRSKL